MALTDQQVELIADTWADVKKNPGLQGAGTIMFLKLFELSPYLYSLFPFNEEEINKDNAGMNKHALQVMETIDAAIDLLQKGDLETLTGILVDLGTAHSFQNVKPEHFKPVAQALLYALGQALGSKFTKEVQTAWVTLYGIVQATMSRGMDDEDDI